MKKTIDCLIIGHNETNFSDNEKMLRKTGVDKGLYREMNLGFIKYNDKACTISDILNLLRYNDPKEQGGMGKFGLSNTFSATIAYLGTYLFRRGLSFDFIHSFQDEKEELKIKLMENDVKSIAISTTLIISVFPIVEMVSFIRKHSEKTRIIVGGPFINNMMYLEDEVSFQYLLNLMNADFYINSTQGEETLARLANAVKSGLTAEEVPNIYYKSGRKYIATHQEREDNKLNENMVDWTIFKDRLGYLANLRTSISCPFKCSFCNFPQRAGKYQTSSVEAVERELNSIERTGKVQNIVFIDDTFNVPVDRFKDILRMMIKNKYSFKWNSYFRCQFADREMVELMKESGCNGVFLGIESANSQMLKNMNKSATVEQYANGIRLLKEVGIFTEVSFFIGYLGETEETVRDTIRFIEETAPDFYRVQAWYCLKNSPFWAEKDKYGVEGLELEWSHKTMDSRKAFDLVENTIKTIKNSVFVPIYTFDLAGIVNLIQRGFSVEQVKKLLQSFDDGLREKLATGNMEASPEVINKIREACFQR